MSTSIRKIAVVTGASSGLDEMYAERLAQRGYDLVLVARRAERLQSLAETIAKTHGVRVVPLVADLATDAGQASVEQLRSGASMDHHLRSRTRPDYFHHHASCAS